MRDAAGQRLRKSHVENLRSVHVLIYFFIAKTYSMGSKEEQEEELEVLRSIYESDECFKEISETTFQYKFGEDGHYKSFLLEISWPENYPECLPVVSLEAFYNKHIASDIKDSVVSQIMEQCETLLGFAMTFTVFDWTREHAEELMANQSETAVIQNNEKDEEEASSTKKKEKKEVLSKQAKRRLADRTNTKGELERGWNWVDVVKHLSKTGSN